MYVIIDVFWGEFGIYDTVKATCIICQEMKYLHMPCFGGNIPKKQSLLILNVLTENDIFKKE